jgi:hypothetical protein
LTKALGPPRAGVRTVDPNRRDYLYRPTTSTVTENISEKKFAFRVDANSTVRNYEFEPTANGARLAETRSAEDGTTAVAER